MTTTNTCSALRRAILTTLLILVLEPAAAWAQAAASGLPAQAQEALDKGVLSAKQQEYMLAIRFFQEALKFAPAAPILFFNLGLAESHIPGRELRAMTWFGAYLEASPTASNVAAVRSQIQALDIKSQGNLARLIRGAQDAAMQYGEPKSFDRNYSLERVAALWARSGDIAAAVQIVNGIPDDYSKGRAQATIASELANAGDFTGAITTLNTIQQAEHRQNAQSSIAHAQLRSGDIVGAIQTTAGIVDASKKEYLQLDIVRAKIKAGDFVGAQKMIGLLQIAYPKSFALKAMAEAQIAAGNLAAAAESAVLIPDATMKGEMQRLIASAQLKVGNITAATKTAEGIQERVQKDWTRLDITQAQATAGDALAARTTAVSIVDAGLKAAAYRYIAVALAAGKNYANALQIASQIEVAKERTVALGAIVDAQAKAGDIADAQQTAGSIQGDANAMNRARRSIAIGQANTGDIAGARMTTDSIPDHAPTAGFEHTTYDFKYGALFNITLAQVKAGDIAGAQRTAASIKEIKADDPLRQRVPSVWDYRSSALRAVGEAQASAGNISGAHATASSIIDPVHQGVVLNYIVAAQIRAGDIPAAIRTVDLIRNESSKRDAQDSIVRAQAKPAPASTTGAVAAPATATYVPPSPAVNQWILKNSNEWNSPMFLDLAVHLKSLPSSNPEKTFSGLHDTAAKLSEARTMIVQMLAKQIRK